MTKVQLISDLDHDREHYSAGSTVDLDSKLADHLVEIGSARPAGGTLDVTEKLRDDAPAQPPASDPVPPVAPVGTPSESDIAKDLDGEQNAPSTQQPQAPVPPVQPPHAPSF